jgi:hypothetical protein
MCPKTPPPPRSPPSSLASATTGQITHPGTEQPQQEAREIDRALMRSKNPDVCNARTHRRPRMTRRSLDLHLEGGVTCVVVSTADHWIIRHVLRLELKPPNGIWDMRIGSDRPRMLRAMRDLGDAVEFRRTPDESQGFHVAAEGVAVFAYFDRSEICDAIELGCLDRIAAP